MFPPPNFERELRNQMTHFYVVCDDERTVEQELQITSGEKRTDLFTRVRKWLFPDENEEGQKPSSSVTECPFVCGYVGFWVMADEAHITTIAVKEELQRKGIGELLMMTVINRAEKLHASVVTLEVRVSNTGAQQLYLKYGFKETGTRKGYYTDNREDAYIMTTDDITSSEYKNLFNGLIENHTARWGKARFPFSMNG